MAAVALLELIAKQGILKQVGEVREQLEVVIQKVGAGLPGIEGRLRGQGQAAGPASQVRVDEAALIDQPRGHGALGNLVGGIPQCAS